VVLTVEIFEKGPDPTKEDPQGCLNLLTPGTGRIRLGNPVE
jgi:hypothetical protein